MNFSPKTEKQIAEENLIPEGVYPFETISAESKKSKAGNDMIEMCHRVWLPDGKSKLVNDWLLENPAYKLFHYCAYTGLSTQYDSGTLQAEQCIGRTGFLKIGIQKDKLGQYPDRNSVRDYVRQEIKKASGFQKGPTDAQLSNVSDAPTEDVPF